MNIFIYLITIFNFSILIVNIYFYLLKYNKKSFNFKNSDSYIFSKRNIFLKNKNLSDQFNRTKIKVSLACIDFKNDKGCSESFKRNLEKLNYLVEIDNNKPDFLIYNVFGCEHKNEKYNSSVKIAYYSENIIPDFSEADYILSQSHILYLDRYFKYPIFIDKLKLFINYTVENIESFSKNLNKTKFCAAVISNSKNFRNYTSFRLKFIQKLNSYKHVDMGGSFLNDVGGKIDNKIQFLSSYKFSISMENSDGDGYVSEKIIESLISGTIPIYYGDYLIDEYINPKVYILIRGEKDIDSKIEYIKKIDKDEKLYKSILKEKIFNNDNYIDIMKKIVDEKQKFFLNIFSQNKLKAKRIDDNNNYYTCEM